jgi:hypothetical protein
MFSPIPLTLNKKYYNIFMNSTKESMDKIIQKNKEKREQTNMAIVSSASLPNYSFIVFWCFFSLSSAFYFFNSKNNK